MSRTICSRVIFAVAPILFLGCTLISPSNPTPQAAASDSCPPPPPALTPSVLTALQASAKDRGPLWRIEKDGRVSWLYGTIHVGRLEWQVPGPNVMKAIKETDVVGVEAVKPENLFALQTTHQTKDGFQKLQAPDQRDLLVSRLLETHFCLPAGSLEKVSDFTPLAIGLILAIRELEKDGAYSQFGLDNVVVRLASDMKKPVVGLDSLQGRVKFLRHAGLTPGIDEKGLQPAEEDELVKPQAGKAVKKSLIDIAIPLEEETTTFHIGFKISGGHGASFAALDLADLDRHLLKVRQLSINDDSRWTDLNTDSCENNAWWCDSKNPSLQEAKRLEINLEREAAMANEITRLHESGQRVFSAVGYIHVRPQGLPALMRAKGFTVEFVKKSE